MNTVSVTKEHRKFPDNFNYKKKLSKKEVNNVHVYNSIEIEIKVAVLKINISTYFHTNKNIYI